MPAFSSPDQDFASASTLEDEQRAFPFPSQPGEQPPQPSALCTLQLPMSPQGGLAHASNSPSSAHGTPSPLPDANSTAYPFANMNYPSAQVLNTSPISLSLPPESQQFLSSTLDPNDPHASIFMAGSECIPQPFGKYTYNPNVGSKGPRTGQSAPSCSAVSSGNVTPAMTPFKLETTLDNTSLSPYPASAKSDEMTPSVMFTPSSYDFNAFDAEKGVAEEFDEHAFENAFINADAWDA